MFKNRIRKTDFNPDELPKTRIGLFFDILKNQYKDLLSGSLLLTLFVLPLFSVCILFNMFISGAYATHEAINVIFSLFFYFGLALIPCFMVFSVGLVGAFEVSKKLVFLSGDNLMPNFFYGIKTGWLKGLIFGFIEGVAFFIMLVGSIYLSLQDIPTYLIGLGIGVSIVLFIIITNMWIYFVSQLSLYTNTFKGFTRNSFVFATVKIPLNFVIFLAFPCLFLGLLFLGIIGIIISIVLFVFTSFIFVLMWTLRTYSVFDIFINKNHYPSLYRKGLYDKEKKGE